MKKTIFAAVLSLAAAAPAFAENTIEDSFYFGMDIFQNNFSLGNKAKVLNKLVLAFESPFEKSDLSGTLFAGKRWKSWGIELGYTSIREKKYSFLNLGGREGSVDSYNLYLDGNYYFGVTEAIELIGSAGIGHVSTSTSGVIKDLGFGNNSKIGIRLGLGAQMKIGENMAVRTLYRYQKGNEYLRSISSVGIGAAFHF